MTNCKNKCSEGKCAEDKTADYKELECAVTAEKNLLHLSFLYTNSTSGGNSRRDLSATYEIVIFNRSCHEIRDLSIRDTLLGLRADDFSDLINSGEVRAFYTSVIAHSPTLNPNSYNAIATSGGELLAAGSTVPARSLVTLQIRITGRGFLISTPPDSNTPNDPPTDDSQNYAALSLQNTALIRGNVCKGKACGCRCFIPLFPLYVKSGVKAGIHVSRIFNVVPVIP